MYSCIDRRKSTRKFDMSPLPGDQIDQINAEIKALRPLFLGIKVKIELCEGISLSGPFAIKAPYYLLCYSERADGFLYNAGFLMQQMDLLLSSMGLGSCYLGAAKPKAKENNGLHYVIALAVGRGMESPYRRLDGFKRKPISDICRGGDPRIESARLAPSGVNKQPWYFLCNDQGIDIYRKKLNIIEAAIYERLNQIDMGIALCHLYVATKAMDMSFSFVRGSGPDIEGFQRIGRVT